MTNRLTQFFSTASALKKENLPEFAKEHPVQSGLSAASLPVSLLLLSQGASAKVSLLVLAAMNLPSVKAASDDFDKDFDPYNLIPGFSV